MTLRFKFGALIGTLLLAVLGAVVGARWTFNLLNQELSEPYAGVVHVMSGLRELKRNVEAQSNILYGHGADGVADPSGPLPGLDAEPREPPQGVRLARPDLEPERPRPTDETAFGTLAAENVVLLESFESDPWWVARAGRTSTRALEERMREAEALAARWFDQADAEARRGAVRLNFEMHEFIERAEGRLLADSEQALLHGDNVSLILLRLLGFILLAAIITGMLGFMLLRRWVQRPVEELRTATSRLAAGEFSYRIPVTSADEFGRLACEVNQMAQTIGDLQAERVRQARLAAVGEMVRRIAHNLRSPLAGVRGLAQVSAMELKDQPELKEYQDRIVATIDRFERWLSDLLSATTTAEVKPEPVEVAPLLQGIAGAQRAEAEAKRVELVVDIHPSLESAPIDIRHFEQAVVALLTNAIQFAPEGSRVTLRAAPGEDGEWWTLRIEDFGPGVPEELREKVFEAQFTTRRSGTGIGLAVADQVVRAHGGRIRVEPTLSGQEAASGPEKDDRDRLPGATFIATLPLRGGRVAPALAADSQGDAADDGRDTPQSLVGGGRG